MREAASEVDNRIELITLFISRKPIFMSGYAMTE